jgi:hypothetical protein
VDKILEGLDDVDRHEVATAVVDEVTDLKVLELGVDAGR